MSKNTQPVAQKPPSGGPLAIAIAIAIDGPAAAGKGTLARLLAERLSLAYLDTGSLYRATAYAVLTLGGDPADEATATKAAQALDPATLSDPALRREEVGNAASAVAKIPGVRAALLDFQRQFAAHPPAPFTGAVLDGRDIGTVVLPDADHKFFITATAEARAARRSKELRERGEAVIEARVLEDISARDAQDASRDAAPLKAADDAVTIDTSDLSPDQVLDRVLGHITE